MDLSVEESKEPSRVFESESIGEWDDEDIDEINKRYAEEHGYLIEGFMCPPEYMTILAPMEFEELVGMFKLYDANGSGTIDKHEARKILLNLGMEASLERAEELLAIVDSDGSGEIEFPEFCRFIVMIKQGDERLGKFSDLLAKMHSTPLGALEHQAKMRDLTIKFITIEEREATATNPALIVVECHIAGTWYSYVDGKVASKYEVRIHQGLGKSIREAKYAAAQAAIVKLKEAMPGVKYAEGDFPDEWMEWINENLERGVEPSTIVTILATKGFHPYRNLALMHRIIVWVSFDKFLAKFPNFIYDEDTSEDPHFKQFVHDIAYRGIDGNVLLQVLFDRSVNVKKYDPHLAQQLANNHLGSIVGVNGMPGELLDFWIACQKGYEEDVFIYCSCKMPVNEERIGRHSGKLEKPLHLAAGNGHANVVKVLIDFGVDVNSIDLKGRSALHAAANNGHHEACKILLEHGARIFDCDFEGNTAMHLAALGNHLKALDCLALKGLEFTRSITSDRVRCRPNTTFPDMVEEMYHYMCKKKLRPHETKRFEKTWLCECSHDLILKMDKSVNFMLAKGSEDIMNDVLSRFDPRPESGISILEPTTGAQIFIPVIPGSHELAILLNYMYRQAALDTLNNLKRTPLHVACDANRMDSHKDVISSLINVHGSNVFLKDMHGRTAMDLLILDRRFGYNLPSSTQIREETIRDKRQQELDIMSTNFDDEERRKTEAKRKKILNECADRSHNCSAALWEILREGSIKKFTYDNWIAYEDPDSKNLFFAKAPENVMIDNKWLHYTWLRPPEFARSFIDKRIATYYMLHVRSSFQRKVKQWEMYRDKISGAMYYYDRKRDVIRNTAPYEIKWSQISKTSKLVDKLGYSGEWYVYRDENGNLYYKHKVTRECFWDRPWDAVRASPVERFCTAFQFKSQAIEQLWYTCEDCNRQWKNSPLGLKTMLKICEPCVFRCHKGHKGIRPMRNQPSICICVQVCKLINCNCNARVVSFQQTNVQKEAFHERIELRRKKEVDLVCPLILANVPPVWADGKPKIISGWQLCRLPPLIDNNLPALVRKKKKMRGIQEPDEEEEENENEVAAEKKVEQGDQEQKGGDDQSVDDATVETAEFTNADERSVDESTSAPSPTKNIVIDEKGEYICDTTETGSLIYGQPATYKLIDYLISHGDDEDLWDLRRVPGLSEDWVAVMDIEEVEFLPVGARVLVRPPNGFIKQYGNIVDQYSKDMYIVHVDVLPDIPGEESRDQILPRAQLTQIIKPTFYFNRRTGESAWTIEDALNNPFKSKGLGLPGPSWIELYHRSELRRIFSNRDELYCKFMDAFFYVDIDQYYLERAAIKVQRMFRQRFRLPLPNFDWGSNAFYFDPPQHIIEEMTTNSGWSYLRRRSRNVGDFRDAGGYEWEEYIDNDTSEYFYWCEEDNSYSWDKPPLPQHDRKKIPLLTVGTEMMYRFPNKRVDDVVFVIKQRFDDETGEDMYDIQDKYIETNIVKWVHRLQLKKPPVEGDALNLQKMEQQWIGQIRRRNEAEDRKKKRERERRLEEEAERLKQLKQLALEAESGNVVTSLSSLDGSTSEPSEAAILARVRKGRLLRINQESSDIKSEREKADTLRRHNMVKEEVERIKNESQQMLSRADILSLSRSLDLKIRMQDRIVARDILQKELNLRKEENANRLVRAEIYLRNMETIMTTPRSLQRRELVRNLHFSMQRQKDRYMVCEWGCGDWVRVGYDQVDHQQSRCTKRILPCTLGCPLKMAEEDWLKMAKPPTEEDLDNAALTQSVAESKSKSLVDNITVQQYHETEECPKRLVCCPRNCLEWVCAEVLQHHLDVLCTRRPAKPIYCRLGCGQEYGGIIEKMIEAEEERLMHEQEQCIYRIVRCNWKFDDGRYCAAQMMAKDRDEHRDFHLALMGITTYLVPGTYHYKVPKGVHRLKVQVWGAGGGSGYFKLRQMGSGGGGAFVEVILDCDPYDVLEIQVGEGGNGGVTGTEVLPMDIEEQRGNMLVEVKRRQYLPKDQWGDIPPPPADVIDATCGVATGGAPGGGTGYGGGGCWACGGGGGYSIVSKRTVRGNQALIVAAGGGGGGSVNGMPGSGMDGILPGTRIDPINGETATVDRPGKAGDSGSVFNAQWPASDGEQWKGGDGSEFGGGGGAGYFGGGGGGTNPGIGGGGGGGASYVYLPKAQDYVIVCGNQYLPGGMKSKIPEAAGVGEWDKVGGVVGQGGVGTKETSKKGNNGCVRIFKPGHY